MDRKDAKTKGRHIKEANKEKKSVGVGFYKFCITSGRLISKCCISITSREYIKCCRLQRQN
ncbi:hypothetical protein SO802_028315 [Lithocarpus litseifolius]|uniref:Uncharacterized protein n=1 Tax=Lithocarpus litseifolius TaxID=425828 RepID=A0AAW2BS09_9ROSI